MSHLIKDVTVPKVKNFAHENPLTLCWLTAINLIGWTVTVITCHG